MATRVTYPIACFPALDRVGGYEALLVRYEGAVANTTYLTQALHGNLSCGLPPDDAFHIMRGLDSAYPWPGLTLGLTLLAAYYFCANQVGLNPVIHIQSSSIIVWPILLQNIHKSSEFSGYGALNCRSPGCPIVPHSVCEAVSGQSSTVRLTHWGQVTHMRQYNIATLVQIMACRLFVAKLLPETVMTYSQQSSVNFLSPKWGSSGFGLNVLTTLNTKVN